MTDVKLPGVAPASVTSLVMTGAGWIMAWRFFSRSLGFISILVLASLLIPADFGVVALASAITGAIDSLSQLGVRDALVRLADDRREYYDTAFTLQVARGIVTAVVIATVSLFASDLLGDARLQPVLLVLAGLSVVSGFENIGIVALNRALDFRKQFLLQAAPRVLSFLVTAVFAVLLRSYWALIIGSVIGKLMGVAMTYVLVPHRPAFGFRGWRYLLHFSFWSWAGSLAIMVLARADAFLLGPAFGVAGLGLFTLASDIAFLPISELLEPACAALFPGFAMASRRGGEPVTMALSIAGALALVTIPFSIGISACSGYLVSAFLGAKWETAQPIIAVLAWMCLFSPFSYVSGSVLSAQGQVSRVFATHALAAVFKVAVVLAARRSGDLQLVALASVTVVAVETSIFIRQLRVAGNTELRSLGGTALRSLIAVIVTCTLISPLPGAWANVGLGRPAALLEGGLLGAAVFIVFFTCQLLFWRVAGRPQGAEERLIGVILSHARLIAALRWVASFRQKRTIEPSR